MCCECSSVNRFCPQTSRKAGPTPPPRHRDILGRWPPSLPLSSASAPVSPSIICRRWSEGEQTAPFPGQTGRLSGRQQQLCDVSKRPGAQRQVFGECRLWICQLTEVSTQQSVWVTPAPSDGADIHTNNYRLINQFPILAPWFSSQRGAYRAWHLGLPCCLC